MRPLLLRLGLIATAIVVVISCDAGIPTAPGSSKFGSGKDSVSPTVAFVQDTTTNKLAVRVDTMVPIGDSVLVGVNAKDADDGLKSIRIVGYTVTGSAAYGNYLQTVRYTEVLAPPTGSFPVGTHDTTVRRWLHPKAPVDTVPGLMVIRAYATDSSGNARDSDSVVVRLVHGPSVTILAPKSTDSAFVGQWRRFSVQAMQPAGIESLTVRLQSDSIRQINVTKLAPSRILGTDSVVYTDSILIPSTATPNTHLTINASARDANGYPGVAAPVTIIIVGPTKTVPVVKQVVPSRVELTDTITVWAKGTAYIDTLGFILRDSSRKVLGRFPTAVPVPGDSVLLRLPLNLADSLRGRYIRITGFAVDQNGTIGYATASGVTAGQPDSSVAWADSALVVYGETYAMPQSGRVGDIVVDTVSDNVILSNMDQNRLEVWHFSTNAFDPSGVAVGSMPWGLAIEANHPDTLLVANSGGTNLSRVYIGTAGKMAEVLTKRIVTRNAYVYTVKQVWDSTKAPPTLSLSATGPYAYSDRPQYVGQLANDRIYFSTRPTTTAPQGTIRWINPADSFPDLHQVITFQGQTSDKNNYIIANADSIRVIAGATSGSNDILVICDHKPGSADVGFCVSGDSGVAATVAAIQATGNSDVAFINGVDISQTGLTDTTYVAVSGDHRWIAFGAGATGGAPGQIFMKDTTAAFISPVTTTTDLLNNASETVAGLAIDSSGTTIAAHGTQATYFANVEMPFHLRLQGQAPSSIMGGGGVAFHPQANVFVNNAFTNSPSTNLAFVAAPSASDSTSGEIDIVDAEYYVNRGRLPIKGKLYGPLRAVMPFPGDAAKGIVLRLFGITSAGLVSIPLTAADIKPVP